MESPAIQIFDEAGTPLFQLRLKRSNHILSAEEQKQMIILLQSIIESGWYPVIGAMPPKGSLLTARDMLRSVSTALHIPMEAWEELLAAERIYCGRSCKNCKRDFSSKKRVIDIQ